MVQESSKAISVVLSSPSAGGKSTVAKALLQHDPRLQMSISYTSRGKRDKEIDGVDYFYVSNDKFMYMVKNGEMLEYSKIYGNLYGTSKAFVEKKLASNQDMIFDLDHHGAIAIKEHVKERSISIFLMPPDLETLRQRIEARRRDSKDDIEMRMQAAIDEMAYAKYYDHIIINNDLDKTIKEIERIISDVRKNLYNDKKI